MHHTPHSDHPKTTKFDVMMLSEADMALLNNESPETFNEEYLSAVTRCPQQLTPAINNSPAPDNFNTQEQQLHCLIPANKAVKKNEPPPFLEQVAKQQPSPFSLEIEDPTDLVFSSISETRFFQPIPPYNADDIDDVLNKTVVSEPLLTEEDLLYLVKKEYTGSMPLSRRTLKQALIRNNLQSGYKRLQAYMTGKSYE